MNNMKYWSVRASTPYCGEDCFCFIEAENYDEAERKAWEIMYENANEWYDDEAEEDYDWADYLAGCDAVIEEITYAEYLKYT